jgi:hypothetical protein
MGAARPCAFVCGVELAPAVGAWVETGKKHELRSISLNGGKGRRLKSWKFVSAVDGDA